MLRIDTEGDKPKAKKEKDFYGKSRTTADDDADVRDIINSFVGRGAMNLQDNTSQAEFARLRVLLGDERANKLATHLVMHNQVNAKLPMEKRVQTLYDVGSRDEDVSKIIANTKKIGYGPLVGFRESGYQPLQQLTGRLPMTETVAKNDDLSRQVMLRLNK